MESLVPEPLRSVDSVSDFMDRLPQYDDDFSSRLAAADSADACLRFVGSLPLPCCSTPCPASSWPRSPLLLEPRPSSPPPLSPPPPLFLYQRPPVWAPHLSTPLPTHAQAGKVHKRFAMSALKETLEKVLFVSLQGRRRLVGSPSVVWRWAKKRARSLSAVPGRALWRVRYHHAIPSAAPCAEQVP